MSVRSSDRSGQISVFLALLFFLMMGISLLIFGGMREYGKTALIEAFFDHAGEEILTQYDRSLYDRYHVFMLDPREEEYIPEDGKKSVEDCFATGGFFRGIDTEITLDSRKTATGDNGKALLDQIRKWETCRGIKKVPDIVNELLKNTEKKTAEGALRDVEAEPSREDSAGKEGTDLVETEEEKKVKRTWKEWKQVLGDILDSGILLYVVDDREMLSSLQLPSTKDLPSKEVGRHDLTISFDGSTLTGLGQLKELVSKGLTYDKNSSLLTSDAFLIPYLFDHFTHYRKGDTKRSHCLGYEMEYLLGGKTGDKANLRYVADQIFLLRFLVNYGYAVTDPEIRGEAETMGLILTGILGFPEGAEAAAMLLIASLCYGESLLEVRALFSGKEVALLKTKTNWNLTFANAAAKLGSKAEIIRPDKGINYEQYLAGLLIIRSGSRKLLYRMMDVMQGNVSLDEPGFLMKKSISSFTWTGEFTWDPFIRRIMAFGLGSADRYTMKIQRTVIYN